MEHEEQRPQRRSRQPKQVPGSLIAFGGLLLLAILVFLIVKLVQGPPDVTAGMKRPAPAAVEALSPAPVTGHPAQEAGTEAPAASTDPVPADTTGAATVDSTAPESIAPSAPATTTPAKSEATQTITANSLPEQLLLPLTMAGSWLKTEDRLYFAQPAEGKRVPEVTVDLMCVGDNLMHSTVLKAGEKGDGTYDFHALYKYIKDEVQATDLACINQETIFINDPKEYTNYPIFGGPVDVGVAVADTGFDIITQATNHCYDKFSRGIRDTMAFWRQYPEICDVGIHDSAEDAEIIRVVECKGIRIAILNYTYGTNMGVPYDDWEIDFLDREKCAADIEKAKQISDIVLVFPHWGFENQFTPNAEQREWGQFFADQGVGAIIGCHPHSLQPMEILTGVNGNKVPVFWSMGNFISHMLGNQNMLGGMARLTIAKDRWGAYISATELVPTMCYGTEASGKWEFYGMRLSDYTDEMAANHYVEHTSVQEMWDLFHEIIGSDADSSVWSN